MAKPHPQVAFYLINVAVASVLDIGLVTIGILKVLGIGQALHARTDEIMHGSGKCFPGSL